MVIRIKERRLIAASVLLRIGFQNVPAYRQAGRQVCDALAALSINSTDAE